MRKNLYWVLMVLLVFACLRSGCGGSGGSDVAIDGNNGTNQNQQQNNTPNVPETPTTPETPTIPETPTTPTPTSPDNPATPNNPTAWNLNGTWRITAGTLTYQDGTTANYVQGSATADPFTIALSDAGDGSYVLSLSAASGGFMKEGSPYCKVNFEGVNQPVRVVWGTSEDWEYFKSQGWDTTTYNLTDANTYSAKFPSVTHDVKEVTFELTSASTVRYTQIGPSIEGNSDTSVNVELTLTRVN